MKFLFSISLSFVILVQSFGIGLVDITEITEFVNHARYHSERFGDNFFVFISKHYGELKSKHDRDHKEERKEHRRLPFQHFSHVSSTIAVIINTKKEEFKTLEFPEFETHVFHYKAPFSAKHLKGLFQPPRFS